jgi:hypothetical protein
MQEATKHTELNITEQRKAPSTRGLVHTPSRASEEVRRLNCPTILPPRKYRDIAYTPNSESTPRDADYVPNITETNAT